MCTTSDREKWGERKLKNGSTSFFSTSFFSTSFFQLLFVQLLFVQLKKVVCYYWPRNTDGRKGEREREKIEREETNILTAIFISPLEGPVFYNDQRKLKDN